MTPLTQSRRIVSATTIDTAPKQPISRITWWDTMGLCTNNYATFSIRIFCKCFTPVMYQRFFHVPEARGFVFFFFCKMFANVSIVKAAQWNLMSEICCFFICMYIAVAFASKRAQVKTRKCQYKVQFLNSFQVALVIHVIPQDYL